MPHLPSQEALDQHQMYKGLAEELAVQLRESDEKLGAAYHEASQQDDAIHKLQVGGYVKGVRLKSLGQERKGI